MGYEKRGERSYFYRSRRVGGVVEKTYYGRGDAAALAARLVESGRSRRAGERRAVKEMTARLAEGDRAVRALDSWVDCVVEGVLLSLGFHRVNHGPWRRRRVQRSRMY